MKTSSSSASGNVRSFAPMLGDTLHTLILGSMPGQKSLLMQQYYAHPRNALWPILCALATGNSPSYSIHQTLSYEERCRLAQESGFGLWDVLASCHRPGSLDTNILRRSEVPNPVHLLIAEHPEIQTVACNGRTAFALFKRHIQPLLNVPLPRVIALPSSSPAMATLTLQEKHAHWAAALDGLS